MNKKQKNDLKPIIGRYLKCVLSTTSSHKAFFENGHLPRDMDEEEHWDEVVEMIVKTCEILHDKIDELLGSEECDTYEA